MQKLIIAFLTSMVASLAHATYYDRETGLLQNYHRDLDPRSGRYVQSDPIGLYGGINTYTYSRGNPLSLVDRQGLDPGDPFKTPDDAAIDAGNFARRQPRSRSVEYGGWIYQQGDCWTYSSTQGNERQVPWKKLGPMKPDAASAIWHTHPDVGDPSLQNTFSGQGPGERGDANTAHIIGMPMYLNTPAGDNLAYDPSTREIRTLSTLTTPRQPSPCSCQ